MLRDVSASFQVKRVVFTRRDKILRQERFEFPVL